MKHNLRHSIEAVSPVIGVVLMVAITVVLAAVVFKLVQGLDGPSESAPEITLSGSNGDYMIVKAETVSWDDLTVTGCTTVPLTGPVKAGQELLGCTDAIMVHDPTNTLLWSQP